MGSILGPNEQVQLYVKQKIYHPKINIDSIVLTNERLILRHPHALGIKKDYTDFNYRDISNVILDKGFTRSTVKITLRFGGDPLHLNDLPNSEAEKAYGIIRENLVRYQSPFTPTGQAASSTRGGISAANLPSSSCRSCGSPLALGQKFCGNCGQQV